MQENVKKARKTLYSLMSSGCHGHNGLDQESTIHLVQTYVLPTLIYGMEVVLSRGKHLDTLEKFYKKYMKLLLSIPVTTATPALYIISGTIPVEATIHKRALTLLGNISRLTPSSIEKRIAHRQLNVKGQKSNKQVNGYWTARLSHQSTLYSSLKYLHTEDYCYGQRHPVIQRIGNAR